MPAPSRDQIDGYISSVEEYVSSTYAFVTDVNAVQESVHSLWRHASRFGPPEMPEINLPSLGFYEVPAPPPPPPPTMNNSWLGDVARWAGRNKTLVGVMCIGAVGAGLLAGYSTSSIARASAKTKRIQKTVGLGSSTRRLVVVVLGGDHPLGAALISGLEKEGYIVITSVSSADEAARIDSTSNGYVKALVLDPAEPVTLDPFIRSLRATLSLRFPLNTPGDPYQHSPASFPIVYSIISLLTLPSTSLIPAPFEHLLLSEAYESYLKETHIVPLQVVQALLPLFRNDSVRSQDAMYSFGGRRSLIFCVAAADSRVGMPYASAQAMSASATVRGAEVLRRELGQVTDSHMRDVRVVVADIGAIGDTAPLNLSALNNEDLTRSISSWSLGEQRAYAGSYSAFLNALSQRMPRRTTSVETFVRSLVDTVGRNFAKDEQASTFAIGLRLWTFSIKRHIRGDRFSVGAGAITYTLASYLPGFILDALINLPSFLINLRNKYLTMSPHVIVPSTHPSLPSEKSSVQNNGEMSHEEGGLTDGRSEVVPVSSRAGFDIGNNQGQDVSPRSVPFFENSWISVQD